MASIDRAGNIRRVGPGAGLGGTIIGSVDRAGNVRHVGPGAGLGGTIVSSIDRAGNVRRVGPGSGLGGTIVVEMGPVASGAAAPEEAASCHLAAVHRHREVVQR